MNHETCKIEINDATDNDRNKNIFKCIKDNPETIGSIIPTYFNYIVDIRSTRKTFFEDINRISILIRLL